MVYYDKVDPATADYVSVATREELPNGARKIVEIDGRAIAVFNIAGAYYAIADVCSHDDGPVAEGDLSNEYEIECPRHGARFDVRTGKVLSFPAIVDIPAYPVRVEGDDILIGLPPAE
jgi:3-phenylpropionate/trans-cinnamate dioxygenase ferredoxin subunit